MYVVLQVCLCFHLVCLDKARKKEIRDANCRASIDKEKKHNLLFRVTEDSFEQNAVEKQGGKVKKWIRHRKCDFLMPKTYQLYSRNLLKKTP